jgi:Zinc-finger associated domain (zf-AD)
MKDIVFEELSSETQPISALQTYLDVTGLQTDQLEVTSLQICADCQPDLRNAFSFRELCLKSHKWLSKVKQGKRHLTHSGNR